MFNKSFYEMVYMPSHGSHSSTIHEHKAPTDESIRLLSEFQDKAKDSLLVTIKSNDNTINYICNVYRTYLTDSLEFHGKFSLNGKEIIFNFQVSLGPFDEQTIFYDRVRAKILEKLSEFILAETFNAHSEIIYNYVKRNV